MDRNTIIAIILSTIVLLVGFFIQSIFFTTDRGSEVDTIAEGEEFQESNETEADRDAPVYEFSTPSVENRSERLVTYEQEGFIRVVMNTRGGNIENIYLLNHEDKGEPLEFFFGDSEKQGVTLSLGGVEGRLLDPIFTFQQSNMTYEFSQDIIVSGQEEPFTIIKRYTFVPDEYIIEMEVELQNSVNQFIPLNYGGYAYTITLGPQIGPEFTELTNNGREDFRKFSYKDGNRRRDIRNLTADAEQELLGLHSWAAINGKYFVASAIPGNSSAKIYFATKTLDSGLSGHQLHLVRPIIQSSRISDKYRFYFGPKSANTLRMYENPEDNFFGISELGLSLLIESSWLGWLENILKLVMNFFYNIIPNWGISIILLTILVKILLYPLTRKSFESAAKMKELGPKVNALKEKYKDDNQKLSQATMELYKKEKVNPLGGCLPILLQFPFFIAMFSLFNNNFDLRGAIFIPGWITDLSQPESIIDFNFTIPLLNWDALRLLPILFLISQFVTTKLTQPPDTGQTNTQLKFMTLGMPIMFFFIMYNMPAGLLVYWIFQNIISTGQQLAYNYFTHKQGSSKLRR